MTELHETFVEELKDVYDAEKQVLKALPKMVKAAEHEDLKAAFESHREETETQINRLEKVFGIVGKPVKGKRCKGMAGLLEEGKERIQEKEGDAALICAAQKVEHYEIAAYGSLCAWAKLLDEEEALHLLKETLNEEKQTDEKLTDIAESAVNVEEKEEMAMAKPGGRGKRY